MIEPTAINRWVAVVFLALLLNHSYTRGQLANDHLVEGCSHGYLVVRDVNRRIIGSGELTQVKRGDRLTARLLFRFKDGSIDDETTVFTQDRGFRLVTDQHIQKGPFFPHPLHYLIDVPSRRVLFEEEKSKMEISEQMDLPSQLSNGLVFTIVRHLRQDRPIEIPFLAEQSKPRLVTLAIAPDGQTRFRIGPFSHVATRYVIKVQIGGVAGLIAPMIGKQPADSYVWITQGPVPTIIRVDTALYSGGPRLQIQPASPAW